MRFGVEKGYGLLGGGNKSEVKDLKECAGRREVKKGVSELQNWL